MAILGKDFLRANGLSVDPVAGKLVQGGTGLTLSTISSFCGATTSAIVRKLFLVFFARQPLHHQLFLVLLPGSNFTISCSWSSWPGSIFTISCSWSCWPSHTCSGSVQLITHFTWTKFDFSKKRKKSSAKF
jgi:hypothetical protein